MSKKRRVAPRNYFLRIPNNQEGQTFYKQLRGYLNSNSYGLDRKASGKRIRDDGSVALNTVMSDADSIRVYLVAKTPQGKRQLGVAVRSKLQFKDLAVKGGWLDHHVVQPKKPEIKEPRRKFLGFI